MPWPALCAQGAGLKKEKKLKWSDPINNFNTINSFTALSVARQCGMHVAIAN
jgi:hypothetical protein